MSSITAHTGALALFATGFVSGYLVSKWTSGSGYESDDDVSDLEDGDEDDSSSSSEPCKMVLGVRMDLKMDKGKIAAQCGHATLEVYKKAKRSQPEYVHRWKQLGQTKIAIKVPDETQLLELQQTAKKLGVPAAVIQDAGRTQVAPGSRTVVGLGPAPVSVMDQLTRSFKLL